MTMKHNIGVVKDVILVVKKDVECVSKAMKKKLTVEEIQSIIDKIPKTKIQEKDYSDYVTSIQYKEYVRPSDVMYHINQYLKKPHSK